MKLRIWYHGTSKENAEKIIEQGFTPWTYFARHLEDALGYGGKHVFEVMFPDSETEGVGWQMSVGEAIPVERIVGHSIIEKTEVYDNPKLRKRIFKSNR